MPYSHNAYLDQRMAPLIQLITPDNFIEEVLSGEKPVLLLCMPADGDFPSQLQSLEAIAKSYGSWLKVGLVKEVFIESFKKQLGIVGTPTYLFFRSGSEINRKLGLADRNGLEQFISEVMKKVTE